MERILFALYLLLAIVVYYVSRRFLKTNLLSTVLPILILDTIPISKFPMSNTDMYFYDLFLPFFLFISLSKFNLIKNNSFIKYTGLLYVFIPILCFLISSVSYPDESMSQYVYIYRKLTVFSLILFSTVFYTKLDVKQILTVIKLYWVLFCFLGIGHYLGYYFIDFETEVIKESDLNEVNVFDKQWKLDGFMGLNRGSIGVICSGLIAHSSIVLLFNKIGKYRVLDYLLIITSLSILILSGSRTGIVASVLSIFLLFIINIFRRNSINLQLVFIITFFLMFMLNFLSRSSLFERYSLENTNEGKKSRVEVQYQVFTNSFEDVQTFLFGSVSRPFSELKNILSHPHSDYFQVLWDYGWIGFVTYLVFLFFIFRVFIGIKNTDISSIIAIFLASLIGGISIGNLMISTNRLMNFVLFTILIYYLTYLKSVKYVNGK